MSEPTVLLSWPLVAGVLVVVLGAVAFGLYWFLGRGDQE